MSQHERLSYGSDDGLPRIYVIGGVPRTGKSLVARRLTHELKIDSFETDHIRTLFTPTESSKLRYGSGASIPVVTKKLRPRLESLIEFLAVHGHGAVLNGECIDPYMVAESPYAAQTRSCFMGLDDPDTAYERIREYPMPDDWTKDETDGALHRILERYAERSQKLGAVCMQLGLPYLDASHDFLASQQRAYDILTDGTALGAPAPPDAVEQQA